MKRPSMISRSGVFLPAVCFFIRVTSYLNRTVGGRSLSDPDILLGRPLAAHIPRIEHPARLDQEQFDLVLGVRFVLHPLRNDKHLSRPDMAPRRRGNRSANPLRSR